MIRPANERLIWFRTFMPLYERAAPLIRHVTDIGRGSLPGLDVVIDSAITFRRVLDCVKKTPEPKEKELRAAKRDFEYALTHCIRASESAAKYLRLGGHTVSGQVQFTTAANSLVLGREYIESVTAQVDRLLGNTARENSSN